MEVFIFDWLAYGENVDKFKVDGQMPKLGRKQFDPQVAMDTFAEHIERMGRSRAVGI